MASVNLKKALSGILSDEDLGKLIRGYDVIGDIVVILVPEEIGHLESLIAQALLKSCPGVRIIAKRTGRHQGEFRKIALKKIAGEGGFETVHKEFGVRFYVNPQEVYFSPRSGGERYRLASNVETGETVLVMFSGVAPFPLMIGHHSSARRIVGIEKNPAAHHLAVKSLRINRKITNVELYLGDVKKTLLQLEGQFDRIVMPLPSGAHAFLGHAAGKLITGGWLHYYDFQKKGEFAASADALCSILERHDREVVSTSIHTCGHISPAKYRICIDAQVK